MLLVSKPFVPVLNRLHPLAHGLIGAWLFTEGVGTQMIDRVDYITAVANWQAATEPGWVTGTYGMEINDFGGGSLRYFQVPSSTNLHLNPPNGVSVVSIIQPTDLGGTASAARTPFSNFRVGGGTYGYILRFGNSNASFLINTTQEAVGGGALSTTAYSILVGTYDRVDIKLYLNGLQVASQAYTAAINYAGNSVCQIGREVNNGRIFVGSMAAAYVYNRALSAREVFALYQDPYQHFRPQFNPVSILTAGAPPGPSAPPRPGVAFGGNGVMII